MLNLWFCFLFQFLKVPVAVQVGQMYPSIEVGMVCKNFTMCQTFSCIQIQSLLTQISLGYRFYVETRQTFEVNYDLKAFFRMGSRLKITQGERTIFRKREFFLQPSTQQCYTVACVT